MVDLKKMGITPMNIFAVVATVVLLGFVANEMGLIRLTQTDTNYGNSGQGTGNSQVNQINAPTTVQVSSVDLRSTVTQSIADSTGVKNKINGQLAYYTTSPNGSPASPFETTNVVNTGATSSTNDAVPSAHLVGVFTNSSYYTTKFEAIAPVAPSTELTTEADLINSVSIQCKNSTSGDWQASGMKQVIGTDETVTIECKVKGATSRGVFRANPALVGFDYNTGNFTSTTLGVLSSSGGMLPLAQVPTGIMPAYETAFEAPIGNVINYGESIFRIQVGSASGVNPDNNITMQVADLGTYTKNTFPIVFNGYQNPDTQADTGATNPTFVIDVD